jgi:hypothetical protein
MRHFNRAAFASSSVYSRAMTYRTPLFAGLLLMACAPLLCAEPAPWYQWRSKADGKRVCAQTSLGPGWERAAGPFRDSRCEKRFLVK